MYDGAGQVVDRAGAADAVAEYEQKRGPERSG
jgi:hypothetical protein